MSKHTGGSDNHHFRMITFISFDSNDGHMAGLRRQWQHRENKNNLKQR